MRSFDESIMIAPRYSQEMMGEVCNTVDAAMAAWLSLLPKKKRRLLDQDDEIDEYIFKASTMIQVYTVSIHRSLSTLRYDPIESVSSCAPPPPPEPLPPVYARNAHIHTAKIVRAMGRLMDMLTLPTKMAVHTPFTICMISTATIAQLSACKHELKGDQLKVARQQIRVAMGALEIFAEVWPGVRRTIKETKIVARELLKLNGANEVAQDPLNAKIADIRAVTPQVLAERINSDDAFLSMVNVSGFFDFGDPGHGMSLECASDKNVRSGFLFDLPSPYQTMISTGI